LEFWFGEQRLLVGFYSVFVLVLVMPRKELKFKDRVVGKKLGRVAQLKEKDFKDAKKLLFDKFMTPEIHDDYKKDDERLKKVASKAHLELFEMGSGKKDTHGRVHEVLKALETVGHPFRPELFGVAEHELFIERLARLGEKSLDKDMPGAFMVKRKKRR